MAPGESIYAGADAGGTRTRVLLVDAGSGATGVAEGGPGNYQHMGAEGLAASLAGLLTTARAAAGVAADARLSLCAGVAGAGRPAEQESLRVALERHGVAARVRIVSDARAALEGAHGGGAGVVCIAGTGSMVLGRGAGGDEVRAGGWGPILGDEGSACWLVLEGIRAVLHARDGWGPQTCLSQDLLPALGLEGWEQVVGTVYGGDLPRERIAVACPAVLDAAEAGDAVAGRLLRRGLDGLAGQVAAVARRLQLQLPVALSCSGGVFRRLERLGPQLAAATARLGLETRVGPPALPAVAGAVLLAAAEAGGTVPESVRAAWLSAPPA